MLTSRYGGKTPWRASRSPTRTAAAVAPRAPPAATANQIAKELGWSGSTISKIAGELGVGVKAGVHRRGLIGCWSGSSPATDHGAARADVGL